LAPQEEDHFFSSERKKKRHDQKSHTKQQERNTVKILNKNNQDITSILPLENDTIIAKKSRYEPGETSVFLTKNLRFKPPRDSPLMEC
jgi:hypothetical protein